MLRVAELAADGSTPSGAGNLYVADVFTELTFDPQVQEGDELTLRNACGGYCVDFKDDDRIRWWNVTLKLCSPSAELANLMANFALLTDGGDTVGSKFPALGTINPGNGVSLEFWTLRLDDDGSLQAGDGFPWYQWALPRTRGWRPTGRTIGNNPLEHEFVGRAFMNDGWNNGPANDWGTHDTTDSPIIGPLAVADIPSGQCGVQATPAQ
jgi:hypothetical protein